MDEHTSYLLELARQAETDKPWLRDTVLKLLRFSIKGNKIILFLCCLLVAFSLFVCWAPLWHPDWLWLPETIALAIFRSLVFGGVGLMGVVFFVVQWRVLHRLEDEFFLRRLTWVQDEQLDRK
jgi:ABC-type transport system involved in cytochrome c biogenesis permease subunit